ncbi:MAG: hypothetical protein HZA66_01075 [Rhodopseudomonas palustris]|uniref:Uncharacterized protein n=1 Tax=Rhodopseudomonas palustris TaxID=1076 RepID=A0A933RTG7_RHOPL|nr:hypothetical protein [Rhodopseudomonas palustris]
MTTSRSTIFGIATLAAASLLAAPALANNQDQHGSVSAAPSNGCSSYMKAPDGSWTRIPCEEAGARASAAKRSSTRTSEKSE